MQRKKDGGRRRNEVFTGFILILGAASFVAALLLDFNFVSPYATLQEDLSYLAEHNQSQKISSIAWMITSLIIAIAIPFYIMLFSKDLKFLPWLNTAFMLGATAGFMMMALIGFDLHRDIPGIMIDNFKQANDQNTLHLLGQFRKEQLYRLIGSSCVGAWAIGLGFTRIKIPRFPIVSSVLLLLSGPSLIFFNWYDPDHLGRTGAMAGIIIGVSIFSVRLINKGIYTRKSI